MRLQRELEHLAHHDPLTGLPNRRWFEQEIARDLARATRQNAPLSVIALDLDQFKTYNDAHGHVAGDRLLKLLASLWTEALRTADVMARLGGDEFVVVLPDCPLPPRPSRGAATLPAHCLGLTCSAGTACWDGRE